MDSKNLRYIILPILFIIGIKSSQINNLLIIHFSNEKLYNIISRSKHRSSTNYTPCKELQYTAHNPN